MRTAVAAVAAVFLVACRGIIGVDTLTLEDAASDAPASEAAADAPPPRDAPPPPPPDGNVDAPFASCAAQGSNCLGCCRMTLGMAGGPMFDALGMYARNTGCICGSGACQTQCMTSTCAQPPGPMDMTCGQCEDPAFISGTQQCNQAADQCANDANCAPAIDCLRACPH